MIVFIKQYGFYRTGTNYLRALLNRNCDCFVCINHLGCKHSAPLDWNEWLANPDKRVHKDLPAAVRDGLVRTVVIVKDPYGWLDSFLLYWRKRKRWPSGMKPRPKHRGLPEHEVIRRVQRFSHLYETWDEFVSNGYGTIIKYEDLLSDFHNRFRRLVHEMDIPLVVDPPANITKRVDPHPRLRKRKFSSSYFLNQEYLKKLSDRNKDIITDNINWSLFRKWGYEPLCVH